MRTLQKSELKVLHAIFSRENPTRNAIARRARLSLVKVSSILNDLEHDGYILKAGKTKTRGGRPSYLFRLRPELGYSLGALVELDRFHVVAMDSAKEMIFDREYSLRLTSDPESHITAIVDQLAGELARIMEGELAGRKSPIALGLTLPGMVDTRAGTWLLGLQLAGITHVPIASLLEERLKLPVFVEDVARSLAFLEMRRGHGRRMRNFVLIYLGMGMGAGIVINRKIYRGFHGLAGEIGHVEHAGNAYRCSCSNVGCLETVISAAGILRTFKDRLREGVISSLQKEAKELSLEKILEAAEQGDRFACSTLHELAEFLGDSCAILIKMFNPQRLIVSGRGSLFKKYFGERVDQVIHRHVLPEMLAGYQTVFADYQPHHEAYGAALAAMNHYLERSLLSAAIR